MKMTDVLAMLKKSSKPAATILLATVLVLATLTILISTWVRATVFSTGWYQQVFSRQTYITSVQEAIEYDLETQGIFVVIPVDVLKKGLDYNLVYLLLREHVENTADFLNYKAKFTLPTYPSERFLTPLMVYAKELSDKGTIAMTPDLEKQLQIVANDSSRIIQKHVGILDLTILQKSSTFQYAQRVLYTVSHLTLLAGLAMVLSVALLFFLYIRQLRRFLHHCMTALWMAGAFIGIPLVVLDSFALAHRLSVADPALKFALDELLTSAVRDLMLPSLFLLLITTVALLVLFYLEQKEHGKLYKHSRRATDIPSSVPENTR